MKNKFKILQCIEENLINDKYKNVKNSKCFEFENFWFAISASNNFCTCCGTFVDQSLKLRYVNIIPKVIEN